jgi:hypothetical protein
MSGRITVESAVVLEIHLPKGLPDPHRCDCSFCKRKGAIVAAVPEADLKVIKGASILRKYQFGKMVAEHFFWDVCGIYTHHRRSTNPQEFGFNIGCLEGVNPYDLVNVPVANGGEWSSLSTSFRSDDPVSGMSMNQPHDEVT